MASVTSSIWEGITKIKNSKLLIIKTIPETRFAFFISTPLGLAVRAANRVHSFVANGTKKNK
jgi:hypothetical protein